MCGIIGYLGRKNAAGVVLEGLRRLEYRGYDSAGLCVVSENGKLELVREVGKLSRLEERLRKHPIEGHTAIGHSRWATHGPPSEENAHPHTDCTGGVVLVHNGIIENYLELKEDLQRRGHKFRSQTDTEVLAHLFEEEVKKLKGRNSEKEILTAVRSVMGRLRGAYAIVALVKPWPQYLIGMRKECPLVAGVAGEEGYLASDIPALLPFTRRVLYVNDGEIVLAMRGGFPRIFGKGNAAQSREAVKIDWNPLMAEKDGHKHFMHKEIHESPRSFEDTLRARSHEDHLGVLLEEAGLTRSQARRLKGVRLTACGTAYYAALTGEYLFEKFSRLGAYAEIASEFRYKSRVIEPETLMIAVSQSGETADTLAAVRIARQAAVGKKGATLHTVGIVNQMGSTLTRETGGCIYTRCGPEIGVASTKAFHAQLAVLYLLSLGLGRARGVLSEKEFRSLSDELLEVPAKMRATLSQAEPAVKALAKEFQHSKSFLFFGRHLLYPTALEGALKLKEISYIHAEGYAAGEMKHGPIALIDKNMPVMAFAPKSSGVYEKTRSNLEEAKARGGRILAVVTEGDRSMNAVAQRVIEIPGFKHEWFEPVLHAAVAQLFAYHTANFKGLDVDQPRNLAKSVTVE